MWFFDCTKVSLLLRICVRWLLVGSHHNHLPRRLVKTMYGATHIGFPIALCCIVAGKDDVPFATVPKYYQTKINQKTAVAAVTECKKLPNHRSPKSRLLRRPALPAFKPLPVCGHRKSGPLKPRRGLDWGGVLHWVLGLPKWPSSCTAQYCTQGAPCDAGVGVGQMRQPSLAHRQGLRSCVAPCQHATTSHLRGCSSSVDAHLLKGPTR